VASRLVGEVAAGIRELLESPRNWYERRALSLLTSLLLFMLLALSGGAAVHLFVLLTERAREVRQELLQRDLRDLVGRFDADERFVLENNLEQLVTERRRLAPLLLPRQYYTALPATANTFLPRQPPRNCFLQLVQLHGTAMDDRLCAYFSENPGPGRYLYLNMRLRDRELMPYRAGDTSMTADALKLTLSLDGRSSTWWLAFQLPATIVRRDRFEITAFRVQGAPQQLERDRRIEGWAYRQPQANGVHWLYVIARLDFKPFMQDPDGEDWPPAGWRNTAIALERRNLEAAGGNVQSVVYADAAVNEQSLSRLGAPIFSGHGTLAVESQTAQGRRHWDVEPPQDLREKLQPGKIPIRTSGGDILWPSTPTSKTEPLPDTVLAITVSQPWLFVEKVFWQILVYLILLFLGGLWSWRYFQLNLLRPIVDWVQHSEDLARARTAGGVSLPYADRHNEVGILAKAINSLMTVVRQREQDEVKNRLQNMDVIGHEIRSPLQALLAIHEDASDPSRRHLERMNAALPQLLGGASTTDAISSRILRPRQVDIAAFLKELATNVQSQLDIPDVAYGGPSTGLWCHVDDGAIEDVLTKLLDNAHRHRSPGTPILIKLRAEGSQARIEVSNQGSTIDQDLATRIFELGVTTAKRTKTGGLGVGLYIADNYVSRMGGSIRHRNDEAGVTFLILLPLRSAAS